MHYARLARSPRLRRLHDYLSDGAEHTTWDLVTGARVANPGTCVSELRAQGAVIECRALGGGARGERLYAYRMVRPVPAPPEPPAP